ncbi:helix-turn-helix domain-containing protein [Alcaligenaceae bacterium]|nr:helix-turn-helix domain-containing protein [Alcaligenaceae bacterium]
MKLPNASSTGKYSELRGDPDFMLSLARGIEVLLAFSERKSAASVADLAARTQLDRAVVRRCLYTLEQLEMVERSDGKYRLKPQVLKIGHAYFSSEAIITRAQPLLDTLSDQVHTNCALAILNDEDVVYLVRSQSKKLLPQSLGMGSRLPAYCTSLGRVLLANLPEEELNLYMAKIRLEPYTEFTVTQEPALRAALQAAKADGYAIVDQEMGLELSGIAIPIQVPGYEFLMALSVTSNPKYVHTNEIKDRYLPEMLATAEQLRRL